MTLWVSPFQHTIPGIVPELYLFLSLSVILIFGAFVSQRGVASIRNNSTTIFVIHPLTSLSIFVLILTAGLVFESPFLFKSFFNNRFLLDGFTSWSKMTLLILRSLLLWIGIDYIKKEKVNAFEYLILILFASLGILFLVSSQDLIVLYLAIEIQSLSLYALASFKRNSAFSTESGLKYFILGAFSSGLLLFGSSLLYGFRGTTNFEEISLFFSASESISPGILLGVIFLRSAVLFKLSAAPFHAWAPDVYEGAPRTVSAFFSIVPKFALFCLCFRLFFYVFYDVIEVWQPLLFSCSILSIVVASFSALYQRKIKRFLAYSSIGHVGYILMGFSTGSLEGVQSVLVYLVIYLVTSICAWAFILSLNFRKKKDTFQESSYRPFYISQLNGLGVIYPLVAFTFTIVIFSIAGTPPLAGFLAKIGVFFAAIESSLYLLAIVGVLRSVISAFYYLRFIKVMYFDLPQSLVLIDRIDKEKSIILR